MLAMHILPQPDDETCGPTCLHAVYSYWGEKIGLDEVIESARSLNIVGAGRGTLAVMLGIHALSRGYRASLYTFNLHVFDPTWFDGDSCARADFLTSKLIAQAEEKSVDDPRFAVATASYLEFLSKGGEISFGDLSGGLIAGFIRQGLPVLTGLSATYLYRCAREFGPNDDYDDIRGFPTGHFVVLHGFDGKTRGVTIADPLEGNPGFESQRYTVSMERLVPAIMLGVLTYDANLLVIQPPGGAGERGDVNGRVDA
ncbi:MAG: hypothetical protein CMJ31_02070 [Phycisphaerae bacterium]|nr:hypothetical protein [Phycisphaerae bacterium]